MYIFVKLNITHEIMRKLVNQSIILFSVIFMIIRVQIK